MEQFNLEEILFSCIDKMKLLMSSDMWNNILLDCSKNEVFILLYVYRNSEVNMTQLADYIQAPLNTATGVVGRLEKKGLLERQRSKEDKRVVTVTITKAGISCITSIIKEFLYYGQRITDSMSAEELQLVFRIFDKVINVLGESHYEAQENTEDKKIKRILIE